MSNFKPSAAGKGPQNRLKTLNKFRDNYDSIDWSKGKESSLELEGTKDSIKPNPTSKRKK